MHAWKPGFTALAVAMALTAWSGMPWATEQAQQRRAARDVRQDTRQDSRQTKQDCRAADQKSNAGCRQDKRHTKQEGRQTARDIKY
ncbi:hypothetical protein LMG23992_00970 [Cupriavidus laharis]|uniref:Secreted protein n=2 Tax=Cupriavidus laharis TaxID=151654 RepID=A0ABM8WKR0_9BURK|nr:hypothetical protein LMG23992_00970 [Cupriavidus laharis]